MSQLWIILHINGGNSDEYCVVQEGQKQGPSPVAAQPICSMKNVLRAALFCHFRQGVF